MSSKTRPVGNAHNMKRKVVWIATSVVILTAFWFLGVDRSWFEEICPHCGYGRSVIQYRVCGFPINEWSRTYDPALMEKVAIDLGIPCAHPELERWHKHRWWGLWICAYPCINGITLLTDGSLWYNESVSEKVRALARDNPLLSSEVRQRVLLEYDRDYWRAFVAELHGEDAPIAQPSRISEVQAGEAETEQDAAENGH